MSTSTVDLAVCQEFFTQNTDITGIGVRVAFYLQATVVGACPRASLVRALTGLRLPVFQALLQPDDIGGSFWTLSAMALGLMIAGVVSAARVQLSFFNAIAIANLVW